VEVTAHQNMNRAKLWYQRIIIIIIIIIIETFVTRLLQLKTNTSATHIFYLRQRARIGH